MHEFSARVYVFKRIPLLLSFLFHAYTTSYQPLCFVVGFKEQHLGYILQSKALYAKTAVASQYCIDNFHQNNNLNQCVHEMGCFQFRFLQHFFFTSTPFLYRLFSSSVAAKDSLNELDTCLKSTFSVYVLTCTVIITILS